MKKVHYMKAISITEPLVDVPFEFEYKTSSGSPTYVASYDGEAYTNCTATANGIQVNIPAGTFKAGILHARKTFIEDGGSRTINDYSADIQVTASPVTDIETTLAQIQESIKIVPKTQAQYDLLTEEERNDPGIIYAITDAGGTGATFDYDHGTATLNITT